LDPDSVDFWIRIQSQETKELKEIYFEHFYQCCGSGSAGIRNFLQDPDPELEVIDPAPDPKLYLNLTKSSQTNKQFDTNDIKYRYIYLTFLMKRML
jgi:hypothetical protein